MNTSNQFTEVSEYVLQADKFLNDTNTKFKAVLHNYGLHFADDKESRYIYKCTLKNANGSYTFKFGQSIANEDTTPTAYDVLACLTKYDPGTFDNFCSEFGYDTDSRKAENVYKAVCKEYENVCRLFSDEQIELLQEIQ